MGRRDRSCTLERAGFGGRFAFAKVQAADVVQRIGGVCVCHGSMGGEAARNLPEDCMLVDELPCLEPVEHWGCSSIHTVLLARLSQTWAN